jgi:ribosomal protein S18 acetylase RimI-like enzyme
MNFYSETILNEIVDTYPIDTVEESVEQFYLDTRLLLFYFAKTSINFNYIKNLTNNRSIKYAFRSMDPTMFQITNCPCVMAYSCVKTPITITYYILLICTKHQYKNMGYASSLLDDFITHIKQKHSGTTRTTKIVLSSLETAVTYYEKYGFVWTRKSLLDYPDLLEYEEYEDDKEYFMMELTL